jgi:hypothetical protein
MPCSPSRDNIGKLASVGRRDSKIRMIGGLPRRPSQSQITDIEAKLQQPLSKATVEGEERLLRGGQPTAEAVASLGQFGLSFRRLSLHSSMHSESEATGIDSYYNSLADDDTEEDEEDASSVLSYDSMIETTALTAGASAAPKATKSKRLSSSKGSVHNIITADQSVKSARSNSLPGAAAAGRKSSAASERSARAVEPRLPSPSRHFIEAKRSGSTTHSGGASSAKDDDSVKPRSAQQLLDQSETDEINAADTLPLR